jgi:hypothetical protein
MARELIRLTAEVIVEAEPKDLLKMKAWVVSRIKSSVDYSDHGMVAVAVFDEEGVMIGQNMVGQPETLSQAELQELLGEAS